MQKISLENRMIMMLKIDGSLYLSDLQRTLTTTEDVSKHGEFYSALYNLEYKGLIIITSKEDATTISVVHRNLH